MSKKLNLLAQLYFFKFRTSKRDSVKKKEMHNYLSIMVKSGTLNYTQLKYLYKNIYNKSDNVLENLIPVSRAMIKGIPINEIERIVERLPYVINSKDNSELYSKNHKDLKFIIDKYITYIDHNLSESNLDYIINKYLFTLKVAYLNNIPKSEIYKYVEKKVKTNKHNVIQTPKNKYKVRIRSNNKCYVRTFNSYKSAKNFLKHYRITQKLNNTVSKEEIKNNDKDLEL